MSYSSTCMKNTTSAHYLLASFLRSGAQSSRSLSDALVLSLKILHQKHFYWELPFKTIIIVIVIVIVIELSGLPLTCQAVHRSIVKF